MNVRFFINVVFTVLLVLGLLSGSMNVLAEAKKEWQDGTVHQDTSGPEVAVSRGTWRTVPLELGEPLSWAYSSSSDWELGYENFTLGHNAPTHSDLSFPLPLPSGRALSKVQVHLSPRNHDNYPMRVEVRSNTPSFGTNSAPTSSILGSAESETSGWHTVSVVIDPNVTPNNRVSTYRVIVRGHRHLDRLGGIRFFYLR